MTLAEMSKEYAYAARLVQRKMHDLRLERSLSQDPEEIWRITRQLADLTPVLTQLNELTELTGRYYERGYYRDEKYTL